MGHCRASDITITGGSCLFREFSNDNEVICVGVNRFDLCPLIKFLETEGIELRVKLGIAIPCKKVIAEIRRRKKLGQL